MSCPTCGRSARRDEELHEYVGRFDRSDRIRAQECRLTAEDKLLAYVSLQG